MIKSSLDGWMDGWMRPRKGRQLYVSKRICIFMHKKHVSFFLKRKAFLVYAITVFFIY